MKRIKFYVCPDCGGILTTTGSAEISCCGRLLSQLEPQPADDTHQLRVESVEDEYYISCPHDMSKSHYISFIACVTPDRLLLTRLYPEQNAETRIPIMFKGNLFYYCTKHGLFYVKR